MYVHKSKEITKLCFCWLRLLWVNRGQHIMEKKARTPEDDSSDSSVGIPTARKTRVKGKVAANFVLATCILYPSHFRGNRVQSN